MSYLVLARKYRPQKFEDLLGQEHVARTLTNAINMGRVHHAFLFTGARGIGKTSAARILARALCCAQGPTATPCGTCSICQSISSGQSVDVQEIDGASNTGVDDVRTLREGVRYLPAEARKKVYIIDEVHMLSVSAFNALLKTLEEPPEHVVFIFATTEVHKIPATIMSRCQRYDFKLLPSKVLAEHLTRILTNEKIACEPEAVRLVAREAAGSVRDGLSLLDQVVAYVGDGTLTREKVAEVLGVADRRVLYQLADKVLARDVAQTLRYLADAVDRGVDLMQMARAFLAFLHDLEILTAVPDAEDLIDATAEETAETKALAGKAGKGLATSLFDRWARAVEDAARSQTPRLLLEMALVDLCNAEPMLPLGDLLDRLEKLEGRLGGAGALPTRPAAPDSRPRAATRQSAPPVPPAPTSVPALSPDSDIAEVWRRVRESFGHRPAMAAALDHAEVCGWEGGAVILQFSQKFALDQTGKFKSEVERALTQITGTATRVELKMATGKVLPLVRSEVGREAEAAHIDQHQRETEAREHPMIRKAQDLFGVAPKEIKTP
ncbi:MAG: DNA polymerase III subunit gamma/tau [Polyangia bacterium]|jgi:DNA polymerase-3 subunit gamma/tau